LTISSRNNLEKPHNNNVKEGEAVFEEPVASHIVVSQDSIKTPILFFLIRVNNFSSPAHMNSMSMLPSVWRNEIQSKPALPPSWEHGDEIPLYFSMTSEMSTDGVIGTKSCTRNSVYHLANKAPERLILNELLVYLGIIL